jgi:hypothetical protein
LRFERTATPKATGPEAKGVDGFFVLWTKEGDTERPTFALRWSDGDLASYVDREVRVKGKPVPGRLLGLTTVDVESIERK